MENFICILVYLLVDFYVISFTWKLPFILWSNGNRVVGLTAQTFNKYYAAISTDKSYSAPRLKLTAPVASPFISEITVFRMLDRLRPSATGLDAVPAWFLRLGAPVFAAPIAELFNMTITAGIVPKQWEV